MAGISGQRIIGVDAGGTKVAAGVVDISSGAVTHRREIRTEPARPASNVLGDIATLIERVARDVNNEGPPIDAIGIGVPELVDSAGMIRSAYLLDWSALPLADRLAHLAPVRYESDVRAAALAEAEFGTGQPYDLFVYVSVGTGISSTLVQEGVPLVGARGGALVLSTGPLGMPCGSCGAWRDFILEDFASGRALAARFSEATGREVSSAQAVLAAAAEEDAAAIAIVDSASEALGSALGWLVNVLDPEALVIGGGLGLAGGRYWDTLVPATRSHIWNDAARHLPIIRAALGPDAGLIGAALAARPNAEPAQMLNVITRNSASWRNGGPA